MPPKDATQFPLILIADDDRDNREMYAGYLKTSGFRVAEAGDGAEALKLARRLRPAAIVLDVRMPNVDGIAATRRIRRDARIGRTPILVLTADDTHQQAALEAGADVVCVKPCMPVELVAHVQRLLKRSIVAQ